LGFYIGLRKLPAEAAWAKAPRKFQPNVYLTIDQAGLVTIVAHRSEMGTGIKTGLPMVLADELEANWSRVKVVQAQGDPKYGDQNTDGSRSMREFYQPMRVAGASARQMLEAAAAHVWGVNANDCRARDHTTVHVAIGRQLIPTP
jgi:isoquinoline 1-oxidoreductase subunit beta